MLNCYRSPAKTIHLELAAAISDTIGFAKQGETLGSIVSDPGSLSFLDRYFPNCYKSFSDTARRLGGVPVRAVQMAAELTLSIGWPDDPEAPYIYSTLPVEYAKQTAVYWRY